MAERNEALIPRADDVNPQCADFHFGHSAVTEIRRTPTISYRYRGEDAERGVFQEFREGNERDAPAFSLRQDLTLSSGTSGNRRCIYYAQR